MTELRTAIVGTKFRGEDAIKALGDLGKGAPIILKHEAENEYDPNAVACYANGTHLGYVPRYCNAGIAAKLKDGAALAGHIYLEAIIDKGEVKAAPKMVISWGDEYTAENPVPDIGPNQNDGPEDFSEKA